MPRTPRDASAGLFHVSTHCVWAAPELYRDDVDRLEFLRHLARTVTPGWTCLAYCLLTNHYHLILDVEDGLLPRGMHVLNLRYALHHNRRHGMRGHVQDRRYWARRIGGEGDLLETFAYLARNPVKAGLCRSPARWPWSSYAATVGLAPLPSFVDPSLVLASLADAGFDPRAALRAHVEGT
ncbi:MAG TPA: hypothetical protein VE088_08220 [Gaiellaceae bacterium]|jgi:REP element-mobilizing transposase RayT|nr:hypothetical protein [Gaiellaceae bacterium]